MAAFFSRADKLFLQENTNNSKAYAVGLFLALAYSLVPAIEALILSFDSQYVIQDDARQFLFWMQH